MEKVETQIIGKGKFTVFTNIDKISKKIRHPTEIICKYLSFCTGSNWNSKKKSLTGIHEIEQIQTLILDYVTLFVLCESCANPQTIFIVKGKKKRIKLYTQCSACLYKAHIVEQDDADSKIPLKIVTGKSNIKLVNFIGNYIKDHPMELSAN